MRFTLLWIGLIFLTSCGQSQNEKTTSAILSAKISLTNNDCQKAIDALEAVGRDQSNAEYLSTLASAYACRAGFSEITLLGSDAKKISSANILGSFSTFSTSPMTSADSDAKYNDLQTAINILLYAGGISVPAHASRARVFNSRDLGNLSTQAIYMVLAQIGKYAKYYGNPNTLGAKGQGANTNSCYFEYADVNALAAVGYLNTNTSNDTCDALSTAGEGHPDLDIGVETPANVKRRMCQGAMLFNNLIDLLLGTTLSTASSVTSITQLESSIESYISNCSISSTGGTTIGISLCGIRSQSVCEATSTMADLEIFFAAVFEALMY
jgi:hypothetical protein